MSEDDLEGGPAPLPDFMRDPGGIPRRRWRWMMAGLVIGLAATGGLLFSHKATYTARSSVLVTRQQIPQSVLPSMISEDPFSRLNAVVGQIMSRQKLIALISEFDLFAEQRKSMPMEAVVVMMRKAIKIEAQQEFENRGNRGVPTARVYFVSFKDSDPKMAAQVANRLAGMFVEAGIQSRIQRSQDISRFLRQELARADEVLREQNRLIAEFNERHRGELPSELNSNLAKLDRLQQQRQSLRVSLTELETQASGPLALADPNSPASRLATLQSLYQAQIAVHTEEHPSVRALARQIRSLEKQVAAGGMGSSMSASAGLAQAQLNANIENHRRQLRAVEIQLAEIDGRVANTPRRQEELQALTERATVSREKYLEFLRKVNSAELAQTVESAQQGAQVSIMDRAYPPTVADSSPIKLAAAGLFSAVAMCIGFGVLREMMDPVMVDEDQIVRISGMPSLGSVARIA